MTLVAVIGVFGLVYAGPNAIAGSPHFIKNATRASLDGANLVVNFKEAGLPSGATETVTLSASETVTYECVNGGGQNPSASNKKTVKTTASTSGEFTADRNGNIVGSLTLEPASAGDVGFTCPPGQTVTFVSVTYSNVTLSDADSGATRSFPGSFSFTNPDAPPVR
jgi:hypothetical protein